MSLALSQSISANKVQQRLKLFLLWLQTLVFEARGVMFLGFGYSLFPALFLSHFPHVLYRVLSVSDYPISLNCVSLLQFLDHPFSSLLDNFDQLSTQVENKH